MKKLIKKLLKEITKPSLLNEQQNITVNTVYPNGKCHTPILRTCSEDVDGNLYSGGFDCRVYTLGCITNPANNQPYQIGDCFRWENQANRKIE